MKSVIKDSKIFILPSNKLIELIDNLNDWEDTPAAIRRLQLDKITQADKNVQYSELITEKDRRFLKSLNLDPVELQACSKEPSDYDTDSLLTLNDLMWLWKRLQENENSLTKPHLHELLTGCDLIFPKNEDIPRNEELEKRCKLLKHQQENREYKAMTKNVDSVRKSLPEDTISYQMKQLNRQGIAIIQFIISVLAAFAFGLEGLQYMVGPLQFGFRLLLGIAFGLIVAVAELYFLAKKLNEDLDQEVRVENRIKHSKMD